MSKTINDMIIEYDIIDPNKIIDQFDSVLERILNGKYYDDYAQDSIEKTITYRIIPKIQAGIPVNYVKTPKGNTLLHLTKKPDTAEFLLKQKADVNAVNSIGETPLHAACDMRRWDPEMGAYMSAHNAIRIITLLLTYGADPNAKLKLNSQDPWLGFATPLHYIAWYRNPFKGCNEGVHLLNTLFQYGTDLNPNLGNVFNQTAMHAAARNDDPQLVSGLLEYGAKLEPLNNEGNTPLSTALIHKRENVVRVLLNVYQGSEDLDLDAKYGPNHWTLLHYALDYNWLWLVSRMILQGASLEIPDKEDMTPVKLASLKKQSGEHLQKLLALQPILEVQKIKFLANLIEKKYLTRHPNEYISMKDIKPIIKSVLAEVRKSYLDSHSKILNEAAKSLKETKESLEKFVMQEIEQLLEQVYFSKRNAAFFWQPYIGMLLLERTPSSKKSEYPEKLEEPLKSENLQMILNLSQLNRELPRVFPLALYNLIQEYVGRNSGTTGSKGFAVDDKITNSPFSDRSAEICAHELLRMRMSFIIKELLSRHLIQLCKEACESEPASPASAQSNALILDLRSPFILSLFDMTNGELAFKGKKIPDSSKMRDLSPEENLDKILGHKFWQFYIEQEKILSSLLDAKSQGTSLKPSHTTHKGLFWLQDNLSKIRKETHNAHEKEEPKEPKSVPKGVSDTLKDITSSLTHKLRKFI